MQEEKIKVVQLLKKENIILPQATLKVADKGVFGKYSGCGRVLASWKLQHPKTMGEASNGGCATGPNTTQCSDWAPSRHYRSKLHSLWQW